MISLVKEIWAVLMGHRKGLLIFVGACVVVLVLAGLFLSYQTSRSAFCDSCHYMDPYVRHWQASTHSGVDCVSCHDYGSIEIQGFRKLVLQQDGNSQIVDNPRWLPPEAR